MGIAHERDKRDREEGISESGVYDDPSMMRHKERKREEHSRTAAAAGAPARVAVATAARLARVRDQDAQRADCEAIMASVLVIASPGKRADDEEKGARRRRRSS